MIDRERINQELLTKYGSQFWLRNRIVPLEKNTSTLVVATEKGDDLIFKSQIQYFIQVNIDWESLSGPDLEKWLEELDAMEESDRILHELEENKEQLQDFSHLQEASESKPVIRLTDNVLQRGIAEGATDIHFEPDEHSLKIRYRIDGMLREIQTLPAWVMAALTSRLKIIANLDIAEKRIPQDGRIKWKQGQEHMDMRVSTLPTRFGEKVVIRILKQTETLKDIVHIGMHSEMLKQMKYLLSRPQGMIFVTGPTGSGKSSTLYAGLRSISEKEINITTIEDPIEYELDKANQVQINEKAGLTFSSALRSILRQDPDVILVGEIRDNETASIAVQASQTGHLVLSTLHTNDALSAITRLKDLKIAPFLIASSVLAVLAQRLVRKTCSECMQWVESSASLKNMIPGLPDKVPEAKGCDRCSQSGYRGRIAVFELVTMNEEMKHLISTNSSEKDIREQASYYSLIMDGLEKLKLGLTTPEELIRVIVH
jgi:type II secretory ATPase GspE/PulE/Tfp pilus assembly ATPase PilB-like protein